MNPIDWSFLSLPGLPSSSKTSILVNNNDAIGNKNGNSLNVIVGAGSQLRLVNEKIFPVRVEIVLE